MSVMKLVAATHLALTSKRGAAMIEYALLAALIAVAAITAMSTLGSNISNKLTEIGTTLTNAK